MPGAFYFPSGDCGNLSGLNAFRMETTRPPPLAAELYSSGVLPGANGACLIPLVRRYLSAGTLARVALFKRELFVKWSFAARFPGKLSLVADSAVLSAGG